MFMRLHSRRRRVMAVQCFFSNVACCRVNLSEAARRIVHYNSPLAHRLSVTRVTLFDSHRKAFVHEQGGRFYAR